MSSVKAVLRIPVGIRPFINRNRAGEENYGEIIQTTCYVEDKNQVVVDSKGTEVVSNKSFYIPPDVYIKDTDKIVYLGTDYTIKALSPTLNLRGINELWVVNA